MHAVINRSQFAKRWWTGQIVLRGVVLRGLGLAILALCAASAIWLYRSVHQFPAHDPRAGEYLAAIVIIQSWSVGWPLLIIGPELFRPVPVPRSSKFTSFTTRGNTR